MKKTLIIIFVIIFVSMMLSACGGGRDLSTPSSRLVGHWRADTALKIEYYFSDTNPETELGTQTEYDPRDGTVFICKYQISSQTPNGKELRIFVSCPGYEELDDFTNFVIEEDGLQAKMHNFTIEYVDSKTEYVPEK